MAPTSTSWLFGSPCRSRFANATTFSVNGVATLSWTYTRSTDAHVWPEFAKAPQATFAAALSRSASGSTMAGSLPPSSSTQGIICSAAATLTFRPVATDPVKTIMLTPLRISSAPTSPFPWTTPTRPRGRPASSSSARSFSATSGVNSLGLITTPLPAISAITASPAGIENG